MTTHQDLIDNLMCKFNGIQIGKATLFNCDCNDLMAHVPEKHFELSCVDPPYGIETRGNAQDRFSKGMQLKTVNDMKPNIDYFNELKRVSENQIIWGYNHLSDLLPSCREFVFWYKRQPVITFSDGELAWTSFQKTAKCFDYSFCKANQENKGEKIHPTQKPTALYEWLLTNYAKQGDKILDTHLGSGSHAIACNNLGFELTDCELDKDYYESSIKRIAQANQQVRLFA